MFAAEKRKGMERTLEKWHFPLHFSLFAAHIDSSELIVPIVFMIPTQKDCQHASWAFSGCSFWGANVLYTSVETYLSKRKFPGLY